MERHSLLKIKLFLKDIGIHLPAGVISVLLISPFLIFLLQIRYLSFPQDMEFLSVIGWTLFQSILSTGIILILALLGMRGLLSLFSKKYYFLIEAFALIPSLSPPLILVISVTNVIEMFTAFPFGLGSLIFFQVLTYTGLCSVVLSRMIHKEIASLSEWAYVHNLSAWAFLKVVSFTILKKDLKTLISLVFVSIFTSLSLPLLVAGGYGVSLEFFIYEKLKNPILWPVATSLILIQSLLVFWIYLKAFSYPLSSSLHFHLGKLYLIPKKIFLCIPLIPSVMSLLGLFVISDFKKNVLQFLELHSILWDSFFISLFLGLGVGFVVLIFLVMMSLSFYSLIFRKFVVAYIYPGVTLLGFVFLLLPFYSQGAVFMKWVVGLSLLLFPLIYRLRGELMLEKLQDQVEVTRLLGGGWLFIFQHILWPQARGVFFLCAGIAAFLACGNFTYSLIVSQGHWNLALLTYDLFTSYRLNLALLSSWVLLGLSFLVLIFWIGVSVVFDKKLKLQY